jgi:hypothetical protein
MAMWAGRPSVQARVRAHHLEHPHAGRGDDSHQDCSSSAYYCCACSACLRFSACRWTAESSAESALWAQQHAHHSHHCLAGLAV